MDEEFVSLCKERRCAAGQLMKPRILDYTRSIACPGGWKKILSPRLENLIINAIDFSSISSPDEEYFINK